MYINPFVAGVISTLLVELALSIILMIWFANKQ